MKFRFTKKIIGYDVHYNHRIKTGAIVDLVGEVAEAAMKDPDMELIDEKPVEAPPVKKAAPKKKAVKKAAPKKKAVKKAVKRGK